MSSCILWDSHPEGNPISFFSSLFSFNAYQKTLVQLTLDPEKGVIFLNNQEIPKKYILSAHLLSQDPGFRTLRPWFSSHAPSRLLQRALSVIQQDSRRNASKESSRLQGLTVLEKQDKPALRQLLLQVSNDQGRQIQIFVQTKRVGRKPVLFIVNPFGGTGKAKAVYTSIVAPMVQLSGLGFELQETKYANHAMELAQKLNLNSYSGIVTVSGDGVFHEVINGLLSRSDWKEAKQLSIGIVGGGSGNGMAKNLNTVSPELAVLSILNGYTSSLDIFSYKLASQPTPQYSHLSVSWTLIGDLDIESDHYRWLGSERFTLAAIVRLIRLRTYQGKLYILPSGNENQQVSDTHQSIHEPHPTPNEYNQWPLVIDGTFKYFLATNYSHISTDFKASPFVDLNSGCIDVIWSENMNRMQALQTVIDPLSGNYIHQDFIKHQTARAFVLEPGEFWLSEKGQKWQQGILNVSGEQVPYERISVRVLPRLMNVFVL